MLRDWQINSFTLWEESGFWGLIKARTGAGKTKAGVYCIEQYAKQYPQAKVGIITPSQKVSQQWKEELSMDIPIYTYQQAINKNIRGELKLDCIILDECHRISPGKQSSRVMELNPIHVLGLSATPEQSELILGKPIYVVDWEEAELCKFIVNYVKFDPSEEEMEKYKEISKTMKEIASEKNGTEYLMYGISKQYDYWVRERRSLCYEFNSRAKHTVDIIQKYGKDKRIVVYTDRQSVLKSIYIKLVALGYKVSRCTQTDNELCDFENKETNILLQCKKNREGWNDPTIDLLILSSTTTNELLHTQTIGRAERKDPNNPNKVSQIYVLVADNTTDLKVIQNNDFAKENVVITNIKKLLTQEKIE